MFSLELLPFFTGNVPRQVPILEYFLSQDTRESAWYCTYSISNQQGQKTPKLRARSSHIIFAFVICIHLITMMKVCSVLVLLLLPVVVFSECEELDCIPTGKACLSAPDDCCDGLGCFGYGFFKKCIPPPTCLTTWQDCSSGMTCCDEMICAQVSNGNYECQHRTLEVKEAKLVELNNELPPTSAPTPTPPKEKNLVTTHKGDPVVTSVGCSLGDPRK